MVGKEETQKAEVEGKGYGEAAGRWTSRRTRKQDESTDQADGRWKEACGNGRKVETKCKDEGREQGQAGGKRRSAPLVHDAQKTK